MRLKQMFNRCSLYSYDQCFEKVGSKLSWKHCLHLNFSKACNAQLLKEVVSISGSAKLYPYKLYCYNSIKFFYTEASLTAWFYRYL